MGRMTTPEAPSVRTDYTAVDLSNHLLDRCPAVLSLKAVNTNHGPHLTHTVRTPSTTLTVILDKQEAEAWAHSILRETAGMSESGLQVADGPLPDEAAAFLRKR